MKADALRLRNLVYDNYDSKRDGSPLQIISIDELSFFEDGEDSINNTDSTFFEPIQLTDEWLLKFGFEKDGTWFTKSGFGISIDNLKWQMKGYIATFDKCLYVHQLQNLYFALTGKELTFKG